MQTCITVSLQDRVKKGIIADGGRYAQVLHGEFTIQP